MQAIDTSISYEDVDEEEFSDGKSFSSTTESNNTGRDPTSSSNSEEKIISRSETRLVKRSKVLVLLAIGLAAACCGAAAYFVIRNEEENAFATAFHNYATEVADIAHQEAKTVFGVVESVATSITSYSSVHSQEAPWPYFTMPHFEIRGSINNQISRAMQMTIVPLVSADNKDAWEDYSVDNQGWIQEGLDFEAELGLNQNADFFIASQAEPISKTIHRYQDGDNGPSIPQELPGVDFGPGNYGPVWQQAPAPHNTKIINYDLLSHSVFARVYHGMWAAKMPVLSEITDLSFLYEGAVAHDKQHPHSFLMHPLYPKFSKNDQDMVGFIVAVLPWDSYFSNVLSNHVNGLMVVLHSSCNDHATYLINGAEAVFLGDGDLHDLKYNNLEVQTEFAPFMQHDFSEMQEHCVYDLRIYPTSALEDKYVSNRPLVYCFAVIMVFVFTAATFMLYDMLVERRQTKLMAKAKRTNAIVKSLFPSNIRDRILNDVEEHNHKGNSFGLGAKSQLKSFLSEDNERASKEESVFGSKPIADLFPSTTVMFADIVGFTAWSSAREPSQVFTLLETIYSAFDEIAKRRRVFKVETIGDCYVAVCGLPDPRPDHAVVMARFARDCLTKMNDLTKKLEVSLGPDTADLSTRIGLHSGPVTAGVLRGDKSRFQLFGDTVNTTSRIEATGQSNKIHISQVTADLLITNNKGHWLNQRSDTVTAKGKGELKTFWLDARLPSATSVNSGEDASTSHIANATEDVKYVQAGLKKVDSEKNEKIQRLVTWNVDVLHRLLKQIIARRGTTKKSKATLSDSLEKDYGLNRSSSKKMVLDEVVEIIHLPAFDATAAHQQDPASIQLADEALTQLKDYVTIIATLYLDNPFHNFEHASHVTMSVVKLLGRIVAPESVSSTSEHAYEQTQDQLLHDHTYGITSDPLTQFACVFAALIHDVDHSGVPNSTLVSEQTRLANVYKNKSVAEQNSVDIAWDLFMDSKFADLRQAICGTSEEIKRFRLLVVNSVMATDIVDKELKALRNSRWDRAFTEHTEADVPSSLRDAVNRKATIVIEHLIQASDVSHTMQHWQIYRKWNERLYHEMYLAYRMGRSDKDPSEFWYKGEIGFFDFYIIPLAKKLKDCGVFGVSSEEYLNYAEKNRDEWEAKGQEVVASLIAKYKDIDVANAAAAGNQ